MLKINNDCVILTLNKEFYSESAIKNAIFDFKDVCDCELKKDDKFEITLKSKEEGDLERLGLEFANYCLALMKQNG